MKVKDYVNVVRIFVKGALKKAGFDAKVIDFGMDPVSEGKNNNWTVDLMVRLNLGQLFIKEGLSDQSKEDKTINAVAAIALKKAFEGVDLKKISKGFSR